MPAVGFRLRHGAFLECMNDLGWQAVGLDNSPRAVKYVLEELRLPALIGTLPNAVLPPASFDLVTLWHALEHVHRPLEVLDEVHSLLAPGGKVLVAVPNIRTPRFAGSDRPGTDWICPGI